MQIFSEALPKSFLEIHRANMIAKGYDCEAIFCIFSLKGYTPEMIEVAQDGAFWQFGVNLEGLTPDNATDHLKVAHDDLREYVPSAETDLSADPFFATA